MAFIHENLARGQWQKLSLMEQLGNIGSEVSRARNWEGRDEKIFNGAVDRALELFDLTLQDSRWVGRLKEINRAREVFCDTILGGKEYKDTLKNLDKYFLDFAIAARIDKSS
ncbi:hypothetical protein GW951_01580 [Candidatus Wolfebacteria bacterium]|uniref:Uncharacterized protein n=1 Tax=Candidatus Wolfebacteria bacterium CG_4_10_14_0_2_um_filter_39_18 TaxID=1975061 RepID=A0A2M7TH51_9BACT|nr:hypothetical protein [Candidatus Wolfebacteria bacterium]PIZ45492.1 MAG: hypothetical protein COY31_00070 [Candidatus Wolfebacteria bacterium CG_4_10_14_0_2_um_filter_39_18]